MNTIPNRQVINDVLIKMAKEDKQITVLTSDSRGSALVDEFANTYPMQFVEVGIAEQSLVSVSAGMASTGKKPFAFSPACFLSMRCIEQIKVDVAYSNMNVKLIGISGGISYGALGMSHHSLQDIATVRAIPNISVIIPSDRFETEKIISQLVNYEKPAYLRVGRNAVSDVYEDDNFELTIGKANTLRAGNQGTIIACGETLKIAVDASDILKKEGINTRVLSMHTIKPIDSDAIISAAKETGFIITIEEHSIYGGLGSAVSEVVSQNAPVRMKIFGLPDASLVSGKTKEVMDYYNITADEITKTVKAML